MDATTPLVALKFNNTLIKRLKNLSFFANK